MQHCGKSKAALHLEPYRQYRAANEVGLHTQAQVNIACQQEPNSGHALGQAQQNVQTRCIADEQVSGDGIGKDWQAVAVVDRLQTSHRGFPLSRLSD